MTRKISVTILKQTRASYDDYISIYAHWNVQIFFAGKNVNQELLLLTYIPIDENIFFL